MKFPLSEWKIFYFAISYNNKNILLRILIYYFNESDSSSLIFDKLNSRIILLAVLILYIVT